MNKHSKGEKKYLGKLLSLFFLCLLLLHFTFTISYQFRENNYASLLARLSKCYTEPLFTQNFKIFAPNVPEIKYKLFVRFGNDNNVYSTWQNEGAAYIEEHQKNRFSAAGYQYSIYKNVLMELLRARDEALYKTDSLLPKISYNACFKKALLNSIHFNKISYTLNHLRMRKFPEMALPKYYQCAILLEKITSYSATQKQNAGEISYLFFPEVKFEQ